MKLLALCLAFFVLAGCHEEPAQTTTPDTVAGPEKRDDLSELLRKADALTPQADEHAESPSPAAAVSADAPVISERINRAPSQVAVPSQVAPPVRTPAAARATAAPKSSQDTMRAEAAREFAPRLRALVPLRDRFEADYRRYQSGCGPAAFLQPIPPGGMSLDAIIADGSDALIPPGRLPPGGRTAGPSQIDNAKTPLCRSLLADIRLQRLQLRSQVNSMRESARRRDLWPGVMRDLFAQYGLTY